MKISIRSLPMSGATVYLEGEDTPLGKTPLARTLRRSSDPVDVRLELRGFQPRTRSLIPDRVRDVEITLAPEPPPARPESPARRRNQKPRPVEPSTTPRPTDADFLVKTKP